MSDLSVEPDLSVYQIPPVSTDSACTTSTPARPTRPPPLPILSPVSTSDTVQRQEIVDGRVDNRDQQKLKGRRFVPREKFRRSTQTKMKQRVHLWTNNSSHTLTPAQSKYLDIGLNFVFQPKKCNRTEVEASLMQWERSMRWKEYWIRQEEEAESDGMEEEEIDEEVRESIFKDRKLKTNLPRKHSVPAALTACKTATRYDVVGSQLNHVQETVPPVVRAAGKDLVTLQKERFIL